MLRQLTCAVLAVSCLAVWRPSSANQYYFDESTMLATYVFRVAIECEEDSWLSVETDALSPQADTVVHLSYQWQHNEVAFNDDCDASTHRSCLDYYVGPGQGGTYFVIVHAYSNESGGSGGKQFDFILDGVNQGTFWLGGFLHTQYAQDIETYETVLVNDGAGATLLMRTEWDGDHQRLTAIDWSSGIGPASKLPGAGTFSQWVLGTPEAGTREGAVRVIRNDQAVLDSDGDGLGDNLEREACTCPKVDEVVCGFYCSPYSGHPVDTDNDGLRDDWELIGVEDEMQPAQLFPLWGARATHKDIFIEVDRAAWDPVQPIPQFTEPETQFAWSRFAALTNQQNPDGTDGVRVHFDINAWCGGPADPDGITDVCGDFGGNSDVTVPLAPDGGCNPGNGPGDNMDPIRVGKFRWAVRQYGGSGSGIINDWRFCFGAPADVNAAHELGHNLGLQHWGGDADGKANRKANYPSLMNYTYPAGWFSPGAFTPWPLDPQNLSETTEFAPGQDVGILSTGPFDFPTAPGNDHLIDWNRDGYWDPSVRAHVHGEPRWDDYEVKSNDGPLVKDNEKLTGTQTTLGPAAAVFTYDPCRPPQSPCPAKYTYVIIHSGAYFYFNRSARVRGEWANWQVIPRPGGSPPHHPLTQPAAVVLGSYLYVVGATDAGAIRFARIDQLGTVTPFASPVANPVNVTFQEVSATVSGTYIYLAARNTGAVGTDEVYIGKASQTNWYGWTKATYAGGAAVTSLGVTPGITSAPDGKLYMVAKRPAVPANDPRRNNWSLHRLDGATWTRLDATQNSADTWWQQGDTVGAMRAMGRPAMLFRKHQQANGQWLTRENGAIWLWWPAERLQPNGNWVPSTRYLWSWGQLSGSVSNFSMGKWQWSALINDDTPWDPCFGSPALTGFALANRDEFLTAFIPDSGGGAGCSPGIYHVVHADGQATPAHLHNDHDDRETIRQGVCMSLPNPDPPNPDPVPCTPSRGALAVTWPVSESRLVECGRGR
jgi:hypothetical protein